MSRERVRYVTTVLSAGILDVAAALQPPPLPLAYLGRSIAAAVYRSLSPPCVAESSVRRQQAGCVACDLACTGPVVTGEQRAWQGVGSAGDQAAQGMSVLLGSVFGMSGAGCTRGKIEAASPGRPQATWWVESPGCRPVPLR
ncbi:hypothetical protein F5X68DRAFT_196468 [Plectosphaerella plurivora]|uniref:Uncharacterized protein n=1 Tax=Plectosphaerella plurivora TaxID=936078 RepID=A0A9P8VMR7_9PEZI|nr:hypothetical protein F5X68DRAFT_196468 [Plectosphaerella plurivora]